MHIVGEPSRESLLLIKEIGVDHIIVKNFSYELAMVDGTSHKIPYPTLFATQIFFSNFKEYTSVNLEAALKNAISYSSNQILIYFLKGLKRKDKASC